MVYVTQSNGHNLQQAEQFGAIRFVSTSSINPKLQDRIMYETLKALRFFRPEEDYLLLAGQSIWISSSIWALTMLCPKSFEVLVWDMRTHSYVPVEFSRERFKAVMKNIADEGLTEVLSLP